MKRVPFLIFVFAFGIALVAYLIFQKPDNKIPTRLVDRIPDGDIIGSTDLLNLSESLSKALYYYQIPIREYVDPDFILAQAKKYGIEAQEPVYFYGNLDEKNIESIGALLVVRDSSVLSEGIKGFESLTELKETVIENIHVYSMPEYRIQLCFGADWLLIYRGKDIKASIRHILQAKHNSLSESWQDFLQQELNTSEMHIQLKGKLLNESGIKQSYIELTNDSNKLYIKNKLIFSDSIPFRLNKNNHPSFISEAFTRTQFNLNLSLNDKLKFKPLELGFKRLNKLIGFPKKEFLNCWTGGLSFREGGFYNGREKVITTEFDDNFEPIEVVKYKRVKIPSVACYLSTNSKSQIFIDALKEKGIFNQTSANEYRFLEYGPLELIQTDTSLMIHSAGHYPVFEDSTGQNIEFSHEGMNYQFSIDSIGEYHIDTRITLPMKEILNSLFH